MPLPLSHPLLVGHRAVGTSVPVPRGCLLLGSAGGPEPWMEAESPHLQQAVAGLRCSRHSLEPLWAQLWEDGILPCTRRLGLLRQLGRWRSVSVCGAPPGHEGGHSRSASPQGRGQQHAEGRYEAGGPQVP